MSTRFYKRESVIVPEKRFTSVTKAVKSLRLKRKRESLYLMYGKYLF